MSEYICPYVLSGECNSLNATCVHSEHHDLNENCIVPHKKEICPNCVAVIEFIEEEAMAL